MSSGLGNGLVTAPSRTGLDGERATVAGAVTREVPQVNAGNGEGDRHNSEDDEDDGENGFLEHDVIVSYRERLVKWIG